MKLTYLITILTIALTGCQSAQTDKDREGHRCRFNRGQHVDGRSS